MTSLLDKEQQRSVHELDFDKVESEPNYAINMQRSEGLTVGSSKQILMS